MVDLSDLIARVEAASGPDRELDALVFKAMGMPLPHEFLNRGIGLSWDDRQEAFVMPLDEKMQIRFDHPAYTGSIDTALTLLPENYHYTIEPDIDGRDVFTDSASILVTTEHAVASVLLMLMGQDPRKAAAMLNEGLVQGIEYRLALFASKTGGPEHG